MNNRVREIRKSLNLTMEKFGKRLGVTRTAISNIEAGTRNLTEQMKVAICREYNIDYLWLTTGQGEMFSPTGDDGTVAKFDSIMFGEKTTHKILLKTLLDMDEEKLKVFDEFIEKYIENKKAD